MGLNKAKGNMYPWVDYTWNPIRGKCPHECVYCYMKRFPQKPLRLVEEELNTSLGCGNFIFVGSSTDMWAEEVPSGWIERVLEHCWKYQNRYLFQTKNPGRFYEFLDLMPENVVLGTTIETNRDNSKISNAPFPFHRLRWMLPLRNYPRFKTMISIEPIVDFDFPAMARFIIAIQPEFVSIGADSKGHGLKEPSPIKVYTLILTLRKYTIEVRVKQNLKRLLGESLWSGISEKC